MLIVYLIIFLILTFLFLFLPGFLLISFSKQKLFEQEQIALSLVLGIVLLVALAALLGFLHLRFLMIPILLLVSSVTVYKFKLAIIKPWKIFIKDKLLLVLIFMGILIQGFINFPSGFLYQDGLLFWSSQGHDGIWHVALMEEISKNFPPQNPIFAGEGLFNYHYLVDILMGEFYRIFPFLSALDLYFRFFPVIFSLLIGISVFAFVSRWQENNKIGYLAVFFTYFVGSFGFIVNYMRTGSVFGGETIFWASQLNTILGNPPHAISISLLTTFFLSFYFFLKEKNKFWFLVSFMVAAALAGFKVSAGLSLLLGLGVAALFDFIFYRRFSIIILCGLLGLSNLIIIKSMTRGVESFLMFIPWWFIRTMVVVKLDWVDLEHKRQHYLAQGTWHAYLRVIQLETEAFLIFLVGNMGIRILGFYELIKRPWIKMSLLKNPLEITLLVTMLMGFLIPLFFVQKGIIYNNIQFMQYFLLIFGFYAAISTYKLLVRWKSVMVQVMIMLIIISLAVPTVIGNLVEFYGRPPLAKISNQQLEALNYLKINSQINDVILNMPLDKYLNTKFKEQPWPIYAWYSTAYIPALASRRTYLSSEEQAMITGYPIEERLSKMKTFFEQNDFNFNRQFLNDAKIKYIYLAKDEIVKPLNIRENNLENLFENSEVIIYKVI